MLGARSQGRHLVRGELGDGLGALGHGVLGQLTGERKADRGLDLPGREGGLVVVLAELARLAGDALEHVVDERVHDAHALLGHAGVRVHLLEHAVDVDRERVHALLLAPARGLGAGLLGGLLGGSLSHFGEKLVGYMLMGIGFWGLWGLFGQYLLIFTSKFLPKSDCGKLFEEVKKVPAHYESKHQQSAVLVGMIHGLAGSASLIGLMPIGNFDSPWLGLAYISIFSFGALISMLTFGSLLGSVFYGLNKRAIFLVRGLRIMILIATFYLGAHCVYANG